MPGPPMTSSVILAAVAELVTLCDIEAEGWREDYDDSARVDSLVETLGDELPAKLDGIGFVIDRLKNEATRLREWEKELASKRRVHERAVDRLKLTAQSLLSGAREAGLFLDGKTGRVKVGRDHGAIRSHWLVSVDVVVGPEDVSLWPSEWTTTKIAASKSAALDAIKATGEVPDGFELVSREGWRSR